MRGAGMGSFVFVYAVPVDRLRAAPGSRDTALLNAARELQGFFATIDELGENREEKPPTCAEAFAQIVNGGPYAAGCGYV